MNRNSPESNIDGIRKRIPFLKNASPWQAFIIIATATTLLLTPSVNPMKCGYADGFTEGTNLSHPAKTVAAKDHSNPGTRATQEPLEDMALIPAGEFKRRHKKTSFTVSTQNGNRVSIRNVLGGYFDNVSGAGVKFYDNRVVPLRIGSAIGFIFDLPHIEHGDPIIIEAKIGLPKPGKYQGKLTNRISFSQTYNAAYFIEKKGLCGWMFDDKDDPSLLQEGEWTFDLYNKGELIISRKFLVYDPQETVAEPKNPYDLFEGTIEYSVYLDAFYIDRYEVTQKAYEQVMGKNPAHYKKSSRPVEMVSYRDAKEYCERLGKRLPTEAEWEKAAKGGADTIYPWGNELGENNANCRGCGEDYSGTTPVGSFQPNGYGLYDMAGNVWEWTSDWYDEEYYARARRKNPFGPLTGTEKVRRGGSLNDLPHSIQTSFRGHKIGGILTSNQGFRCAKFANETSEAAEKYREWAQKEHFETPERKPRIKPQPKEHLSTFVSNTCSENFEDFKRRMDESLRYDTTSCGPTKIPEWVGKWECRPKGQGECKGQALLCVRAMRCRKATMEQRKRLKTVLAEQKKEFEKSHRYFNINRTLQSTLRNLFHSCKWYWADAGKDKNCTPEKVSGSKYDFRLPQSVTIEASGNEKDFFATASHKKSSTIFVIEADGKISSVSHVRLLDLSSEQIRDKIPVVGPVRSLAYAANGKLLAFNGDRERVKFLKTDTNREIKELESAHPIGAITISGDGTLLAVGNSSQGSLGSAKDHAIEIWEISTGEKVSTLKDSGGGVRSLSFSPDGRFLASGGVDYAVYLWDVGAGRQIYKLEEHGREVKVAYSPDGEILASANIVSGSDYRIHLREASTGKLIRKLEDADPDKKNKMGIDSLVFSPDGRMIAAGVHYAFADFSSAIKLWDANTGEQLREWRIMDDYSYVVAFSPDGKILAVASHRLTDSRISLYDTFSWKAVRKIETPGVRISALVFSPDGKTLAFGGNE